MTPPLTRLFVLLASESDFALVLRRGPSKQSATLGWNRANDTFQLGQWLKGKIDFESCDLSPDGLYFLYEALKYGGFYETRGRYTVLSRAPYLKKIQLWGPYAFGGVFCDSSCFRLNKNQEPTTFSLPALTPIETTTASNSRGFICGGVQGFRRERDGWTLQSDALRQLWRKSCGDWALFWSTPDSYELRYEDDIVMSGQWQWADFDPPRNRLCFALDGQLWSVSLQPGAEPVMLHDFNAMRFEPRVAPY